MFFSVLIPVYNTGRYLHECIGSVLCQSFGDFEILLIDDGALDNSSVICDEHAVKDPRIRVLHKNNQGLLLTRRCGFIEARGDYFVCLDSDDYLIDADAFKNIYNLIQNQGCDMVVYDYICGTVAGKDERKISLFNHQYGYIFAGNDKKILYEKILIGADLNAIWIKACKNQIIDRNVDYSIWNKELYNGLGEDYFQSFPLLSNANKIGYINKPFYYYRWNSGSISRNSHLQFYGAYKTIYQREDEYLKIWGIDDEVAEKTKRKRIRMILSVIISGYFHCKETGTVRQWDQFVYALADDQFFRSMFAGVDKKKVLPYYRVVYSILRNGWLWLAKMIIESVHIISNLKKRVRMGNA